jgi:transcription elongation factor Elf1
MPTCPECGARLKTAPIDKNSQETYLYCEQCGWNEIDAAASQAAPLLPRVMERFAPSFALV